MNIVMNMMLMSKNRSKNKSGELTDKYHCRLRLQCGPVSDLW